MKNTFLFLLLIALLGLSACIKVENDVVGCSSAPTAPQLITPSYSKNLGDTLMLQFANYQSDVTYNVIAPDSTVYSSANGYPIQIFLTSAPVTGLYRAFSTTSPVCQSDTVFFQVNVTAALPSCGMANNTFKLGGSNTVTTSISNGYDYIEYYHIYWSFGTYDLNMNFGKQPSTTQTQIFNVVNRYGENLADNECSITYNNYYGTGGTVFCTHNGGKYNFKFCNVTMNYGSQTYPGTKGNLYCYQ